MPIILISSDAVEAAAGVAAGVAQALGYRVLGPELLAEAAGGEAAAARLARTLTPESGFFSLGEKVRNHYLALIQAAVLERLTQEPVVCHGLAAHLYLHGVAHVIRVRLLPNLEAELRRLAVARRTTLGQAVQLWDRGAVRRRRWALDLFRLDEADPNLYDLTINLGQIDPDKAVTVIADMAGYRRFQATTYSRRLLEDLALAARVRAALSKKAPQARVEAREGRVTIQVTASPREERKMTRLVTDLAGQVEGVKTVEIKVIPDLIDQAAWSGR